MQAVNKSAATAPLAPSNTRVPFRLEVVVIPVADPERAKQFFLGLGWRLDNDFHGDNSYRRLQLTPPGSNASVMFGNGITDAAPGSRDGLVLVVDDIAVAHEFLTSAGVDVSPVFHDAAGGFGAGFHLDDASRAIGPDPHQRSYASFATFPDSESNRWTLQQVRERLPGRDWDVGPNVAALAQLLHETATHHDSFEKSAPPHDWWDWYAAYLHARQHGSGADEAIASADQYMADVTQHPRRDVPCR